MFAIFASALLTLGLNYIVWYLNKDGSKQKNRPPSKDQYSFPTADQTRPIPKFWGTIKMTSPNVINYEITRQKRIVIKTKSFFGTETQETPNFKTYVDMHLALANTDEQQGAKLKKILVNDDVIWNNDANNFGDISSSINKKEIFGDDNGVEGNFTFLSGRSGQLSDPYIANKLYNRMPIKFRKLSHIVFKDFYVGNSSSGQSSIAPFSFVLEHAPRPDWAINGYTSYNGDCNPAVVIYYMMTEYFSGGRFREVDLDLESFREAHIQLYNERLGISLLRQESIPIEDDINDILEIIDGQIIIDQTTGKNKLTLNRLNYNPDDLLHLTFDNGIKKYSTNKTTSTTTVSEVRCNFTDINDNFSIKYQPFKNEAARFRKEKGEIKTLNYEMITNSETANKIATREGYPLTSSLIQLSLTTNRILNNKNIGDCVKVSLPTSKIDGVIFRIVNINKGTLKNPNITVKLIQDVFGRYNSIFSSTNPSSGVINTAVAVQSNLKIINAPCYFNKRIGSDKGLILTYAEATNSRQLNYDLYTKIGSEEYIKNGASLGFSYVANFENNVEVNDINMTVSSNNFDIETQGIVQLKNGYNLALIIDQSTNKSEFINFEEVIYNQLNNTYLIKNINRGLFDTIPKKYNKETLKIYVINVGSAMNTLKQFEDFENVKIKSINKTASDAQEINASIEYNFTTDQRYKKPLNISNLKINGINFKEEQNIDDVLLTFDFSYRDQSDLINYYNDDSSLNNDGNTVNIKLYNSVDTLLKEVNLSANEKTWTYTDEAIPKNLYIRAEIKTIKNLFESSDNYDIIIKRT